MDSSITLFIQERRVEMTFFPVVVFGYLSVVTESRLYMLLTLYLCVASAVAFHWAYRAFGGLNPSGTQEPFKSLLFVTLQESFFKTMVIVSLLFPYAVIWFLGIPYALYINFSIGDIILVALVIVYVIFVATSQAHRLFDSNRHYRQMQLSDYGKSDQADADIGGAE